MSNETFQYAVRWQDLTGAQYTVIIHALDAEGAVRSAHPMTWRTIEVWPLGECVVFNMEPQRQNGV